MDAGGEDKIKTELGTRIASRLSLKSVCPSDLTAIDAGGEDKIKTEPGTRIASRLSLKSVCPNDLTAIDAGGEDKIKLSLERELRPDSVWWRAGRDSNPRPFDS